MIFVFPIHRLDARLGGGLGGMVLCRSLEYETRRLPKQPSLKRRMIALEEIVFGTEGMGRFGERIRRLESEVGVFHDGSFRARIITLERECLDSD